MLDWLLSLGLAIVMTFSPSPADGGEVLKHERIEQKRAVKFDPGIIMFRSGQFDPLLEVPSAAGSGLSEFRDRHNGLLHFIVQFHDTPTAADRSALKARNADILYYIPNNAYIVKLDASRISEVIGLPGVRTAFRLPKWAKINPAVTEDDTDVLSVELIAGPGVDARGIAKKILRSFTDIEFITSDYQHGQGRIVCSFPAYLKADFLDTVSGMENVLSIMPYEPKQLLNDDSIWVCQSYDTANTTAYNLTAPVWNQNILGTDQIICVNDSGLDSDMCFYRYDGNLSSKTTAQHLTPPDTGTVDNTKKVIAYYVEPGADEYDTSNAYYHGTHVAGSVLGDNYAALSTPTSHGHDNADGMAPNAQLVMQDVGDSGGSLAGLSGDLTDMFRQAYDAGARIHSDSWGTTSDEYSATSKDMDEFMWRHEDFLFLVAMGNSGISPGDGSIGSPATAKNIVGVGATTNGGDASQADNLKDYSRGPVHDGRLKPDVVTPGYNINSASGTDSNTDDNCSPKTMNGTSMATPTTSGLTALIRQYFTDGFYPSGTATAADGRIPSGALLKACLVNGAMPLGGIDETNGLSVTDIPSMDQGWGRTHLDNVLFFSSDNRKLRLWDIRNMDGLMTGEQNEYTVNVTSSTEPFKVHLVWTDPESTTLAAANLVNNLDLEVIEPDGTTTYLGNVFSGGVSATGGTADALNPVEGVYVQSPSTGLWTVRVKGTTVPGTGTAPYSDHQGYALVVTFADCGGGITAPVNLTAVDNGTTGIDLNWDAVGGATGYLVYRAEGASPAGEEFTLIDTLTGTAYTDTGVQGGYTYSYKVRATDDCNESAASNTASDTYTGNCALYPDFGGLESVTNDTASPICDLVLTWSAGSSNCPLGNTVVYNIYRNTTPYFTPDGATLLVSGISGTTYTDYTVDSLTTYYYIVRAEDSTTLNGGPNNGGNEDTNTVMLKGTAWAVTSVDGTFSDDGGDTNAKLFLEGEWSVTDEQNHTTGGTYSYHSAEDGNTYSSDQCIAATTPPLSLQSGLSPQLSYWADYNIEEQWDGVVVEVSNDDGGSWTPSVPTAGYPGDFSQTGSPPINGCGYPATQDCINGPAGNGALSGWIEYTHDLSAYAGQTVLIRWNFSTDPGMELEGFYLDDIQVTFASVNGNCATSNGRVTMDRDYYKCDGDTININVGDSDLIGSGTLDVTIDSTTEAAGEVTTLVESPGNSGNFVGSVLTTSAAPAPDGLLSLSDGDMITVTYMDADDGLGGINISKTDTADADCVMPVISNVQAINITDVSAEITWDTNESADSYAVYDPVSPPSANSEYDGTLVTAHSLVLTGLTECTKYYFYVESADIAGNSASDDNGGIFYEFMTKKSSEYSYNSTDTPVGITDSDPAGVYSTLNVAGDKVIEDVNVTVNITHTYDADLDIYLIAPDSTQVELSTDNGGSSDNYVDAVFDDEAPTSITAGTAPFTGSYMPEGLLSDFDGKTSLGDWKLWVVDDAGGDTGTIDSWTLTITTAQETCPVSDGWVELDDTVYGCDDTFTITLVDIDLAGTGTYGVDTYSTTEAVPETVALTETGVSTGIFEGTFDTTSLPAASGDGFVSCVDADTLTVEYVDADDGEGGIDVVKTDTAVTECLPPVISNVQITNITGGSAEVTWNTDESADSTVIYENALPPSANTESDTSFVTAHNVLLTGLTECTTYYLYVRSADVYGNQAEDDNGGTYYTFTTTNVSSGSFNSTDTPLSVPDGDSGGVYSTINIADTKTVEDVNVTINITHTYDSDLDIYLIAPGGAQVELTTDNGGGSDNYYNTVFDDEASASITTGTAPFTGSYRPEGILSSLDGTAANGAWQLWVVDDTSIDSGTLDSWSIDIQYPLVACGPSAEYESHSLILDTCSSGGPGDGDGIWDAGEVIDFDVTIYGNGTDPLTGVSAVVTPITAGVSMIADTANFNDLAAGGSRTSLSSYGVQLSDSLSCGSTVEFQIDITSNEGSWTDTFTQIAGRPVPADFTLVSEDFEGVWGPQGDNPPAGWTIEDYGDEATPIWNNNDWYNYTKGGAYDQVARVYYSPVENQDERLITPVFDIPGAAIAVDLEYDHYFNNYSTDDFGYVDYTSDQNPGWANLVTYDAGTANMAHETISLLTYAGDTNAQIRFRYIGNNDWYWEVDNVEITGTQPPSCDMNSCTVTCGEPTASFTHDAPACDGNAVSFTDTSTPDGACTITGWNWDFGDGTGTSTLQNPVYTYGTPGTYTTTLTVTQSDAGTDNTGSTVIIRANPSAAPADDGPVCDGDTINFSANPSGGVSPYSYAWDFGDGAGTSTVRNPSYTYGAPGTYTAGVDITDANGCTSGIQTTAAVVHTTPAAGFTWSAAGCSISFTDTTSGGTTPYGYDWDFGDGIGTSTEQNPVYTYGSGGTYTVILNLTDAGGCMDTSAQNVNCSISTPPSMVPDGKNVPGSPMTAVKSGDNIAFSFDSAADASAYNLYRGIPGSWYSHDSRVTDDACSGSADTSITDTSAPLADGNDYYYLVNSTNGLCESGFGYDGNDVSRENGGFWPADDCYGSCP